MRWICFFAAGVLTAGVTVVDSQGRAIAGARVDIAGGTIRVSAPGFADATVPASDEVTVVLDPVRPVTRITVAATPGHAEEIQVRPEMILPGHGSGPTVGHSLETRPNVSLQQTGAGQVSPFLRGLTGYQVLTLIDGVRFNNATFRSGPNQYLAYIEPSQASSVEAMLGPGGTQYGSDGLGGTLHVHSPQPRFDAGWHGTVAITGESADLAPGANASLSRGSARVWFATGAGAQRHNDLRAGGGVDSRNVLTRFYGLTPREATGYLGNRQRDTAYTQAGAHGKLAVRPSERQSFTAWYQRGEVHGLRNTKDLWGGLGRLASTLDPQILDLFYARYERLGVAGFDSLSGRVSMNQQQDGGLRQGLRVTDPVTRDWNRVRSFGYSGQAAAHFGMHSILSAGGDVYLDQVRSSRTTGGVPARPLYPDRAAYSLGGAWAQGATDWRRLRAGYGLRYSRAAAFGQTFPDWTGQASLLVKASRTISVHALWSRGFRAPNLNDISTIGLQDLGFEVPAREAASAGALLGDSAGEGAVSKGVTLSPLGSERLRNLETGLRIDAGGHRARVQVFDALLSDPISRRTLLFPASGAPSLIAGIAVAPLVPTATQRAQGVVTVAPTSDPRALKAFVNDGRARYWGVEADWEKRIGGNWFAAANYSFLLGRDLDPNRNIRRLPPQQGAASVRYVRARFWCELHGFAAGAQERLSGGDRDDERIGASRRRQDIADFFNSARGREASTGETLLAIQNRVLPGVADSVRVTLYPRSPGWAAVGVRGGLPLSETLSLEAGLSNMADRNYRVHGSGIDAPGRSARVALLWRF